MMMMDHLNNHSAVAIAASVGLLAHNVVFIRGEWHVQIWEIILGHLFLTLFSLYVVTERGSLPCTGETWQTVAAMAVAYLASLFSSMSVYRLFFHQTRKFPGPKWAAVTKLWHVSQVFWRSDNHALHKRLHDRYGSIVRTGPNELSIADPKIYQLLDGWKNTTSRDIWYDILQPRYSSVFTRDEECHRVGRKVWVHSMSGKALDSYHPRIATLAQALSDCIREQEQVDVDVDDVMSWFSFDVMGEITFGCDFDLLRSRRWQESIQHRDRALALVGRINDVTWIAHLGFRLVPWLGQVKDWFRLLAFCNDRIEERILRGADENKVDMAEYFLQEQQTPGRFKDRQDSKLYLDGQIVTAVVAGSDTSRAGLIAICWFLSKYPEHGEKILAEIQNVDGDVLDNSSAAALANLTHLNAFINEVLRLAPPVMTGTPRVTGPQGLMVGDTFIPPDTKINTPRHTIMRLESAFPLAQEFIPERWYSRPELIKDKSAFSPFSVGGRQCVGMSVAYSELRCVTAVLVRDFKLRFAPGYDEESMWKGMRDQVTAQPGQVLCCFEPRRR